MDDRRPSECGRGGAGARAVYVDLDDVLCETARMLSGIAAREFGRNVPFERIHEFDLARSFSLNPEEYARLMAVAHTDEALRGIEPVPGALDAVRQWRGAGRVVSVVTGRPPSTAEATRAWLRQHGLGTCEVVFVDKYGRHEAAAAARDCLTLDELAGRSFDLAVEDEPRTAAFLLGRTTATVALLARPWNARASLPEVGGRTVVRCRDWSEILARWP